MEKIRIAAVEANVTNSITETFQTMLGMDLVKVGQVTDPGLNENRLVGAVHYAGEVVGTLALHVSQAFARQITSAMLGTEESQSDDDEAIKDVLGELTNIVSGNLKSDFLNSDLACVISTPSITHGSDFRIEPSKLGERHQWVFRCKKNEILIEIGLKEDIGAKAELAGLASLSSLEIRDKINSVDIPTTVINSVIDVFFTMLSMEVVSIAQVPPGFREDKRTVGTVSFAGDVQGLFNIQVNEDFSRTMTAAMLGIQENEVGGEEEMFDVLRELSNIIGGNLKSAFVDAGLSCVLSTPAITNGSDFRVESLNPIKTQRFLFSMGENAIIIIDAGVKKDDPAQKQDQALEPVDLHADEDPTEAPEQADELRNLNLILGIPLEITVELGRTQKRIQDLLRLKEGSVVELTQLEGEPVDLLVNNTLVAKGEVVVEKEKYGIRIVEIVNRKERLKSLW
jgi:flagellar motor switch protein FliN